MMRASVLYGHLGAAFVIALGAQQPIAQTAPAEPSPHSIKLTLYVPKTPTPMGQPLWISLAVDNLTQNNIDMPDWTIHIEGKDGEPPTTLRQREWTHTLRPGEAEPRRTGYTPGINPGDWYTQKTDATQLYDLRTPGRYTVYAEAQDALEWKGGKWVPSSKSRTVRTPTAVFDVTAPTATETTKP